MSVMFLQGQEADEVLDTIERHRSATVVRHLSQRDYGEERRDAALVDGYVYDEISQAATDHVAFDDTSPYPHFNAAP